MPAYEEFALFRENADEAGLAWSGPPVVARVEIDAPSGHRVSALRWGEGEPQVVLVHGGAQNAHTWDTVALALGRPLVAVDLPGHGHSAWRDDHDYRPQAMAGDIAAVIEAVAPGALAVTGMSLGGLTALAVAAQRPDLVRRLALVDITPGVDAGKAKPIRDFVDGPESFASFDEILDRTVAFNPTRSVSSLRRGILHNAVEQPDGSWTWRYDRIRFEAGSFDEGANPFGDLWDAISGLGCPLLLLRGAVSGVVDDADVAEVLRRQPAAQIVVVDGAGHSIQGDRPVELARLLDQFLDEPA